MIGGAINIMEFIIKSEVGTVIERGREGERERERFPNLDKHERSKK
jgi:hypothetical protein